ncbi:MAG: asparagine synthase C-terminal domain-containing protein, partial [Pseudomonadota bacterium]
VSGGLDSSATYAMAVHLQQRQRLPAPAVRGYTLDFAPGTPAHELEYARSVARHTNTAIEECAPALKPVAWYLQRASERCDLPDIPNGAMMLTMLETARAQGARVMIGGYGGDEYTGVGTAGMYYADLLSELQWTGLLQAFRRDVPQLGILRTLWWFWRQGVAVLSPPSIKQFIRNFRSVPMLNPWWLDSRLKTVLAHRRVVNAGERNIKVARHSQRRILRFYEHADLHHMMELSDYRSARCGMEVRSAYYNKCMLQFALSTGEWTRQRGMEHRWLHRQAMRDLLPAMVRNRRDKADFGEMVFMTNEEIRREHLNAVLVRREQWLDKDAIEKLRTAPATLQDIDVRDWVLWYLVCCDAVAG